MHDAKATTQHMCSWVRSTTPSICDVPAGLQCTLVSSSAAALSFAARLSLSCSACTHQAKNTAQVRSAKCACRGTVTASHMRDEMGVPLFSLLCAPGLTPCTYICITHRNITFSYAVTCPCSSPMAFSLASSASCMRFACNVGKQSNEWGAPSGVSHRTGATLTTS